MNQKSSMAPKGFGKTVAVTAFCGLIVGATALVGCGSGESAKTTGTATNKAGSDKNACKGKDGCAATGTATADKHACKGLNSCKGKGGCDNGCAGKNSCKGKGGCEVPVVAKTKKVQ